MLFIIEICGKYEKSLWNFDKRSFFDYNWGAENFLFYIWNKMGVESQQSIKQIQKLKPYLPEKTQQEMEKILEYWKVIKSEWEKKKREFWNKCNRDDFLNLLWYRIKHKEELEWKYKYLCKMTGMERVRFIEEYLHDDILYSWNLTEKKIEGITYNYSDFLERKISIYEWYFLDFEESNLWAEWAELVAKFLVDVWLESCVKIDLKWNRIWEEWAEAISHVKLKEWVCLNLGYNGIWAEWAVAISKMKLKDWVNLNLESNEIWDEWAVAISQMELKEWVELSLENNGIWDEWAVAISQMELKEWVVLDLHDNEIWDEWIKAIAENMKLKEWIFLNLSWNVIWDEWAEAISHMELKDWVNLKLRSNQIWDEWAKAISKMELKENVRLILQENEIWDEWAKAIMKNMKLKNWVVLKLSDNNISDEMKKKLEEWEKSYNNRGIDCKVFV